MALAYDSHGQLLQHLRDEARSVRSCFTQYAFQGIAFAAAVLGAELVALQSVPLASLASIPLIFLLLRISRLGLHKFATANRQYGYQLHLERTADHVWQFPNDGQVHWTNDMRNLGWEEALRAWRIVQPKIFKAVYVTPEQPKPLIDDFRPSYYRIKDDVEGEASRHLQANEVGPDEMHDGGGGPYPWFLPERLAEHAQGAYHGGSYLKTVLFALLALQYFAVVPMLVAAMLLLGSDQLFGMIFNRVTAILLIAIMVLVIIGIALHNEQVQNRRRILETGLLSIHSCAIIWQAIAVAHYRAISQANAPPYWRYTTRLVEESNHLVQDNRFFSIHTWV